MPTPVDTIAPATAALVSAFVTWQLGRRSQHGSDRDTAFEQAWRLVEGYREEIDRLRARVTDLEQAMEHQRVEHERDRARWAAERRTLIAAFRRGDDPTPPPQAGP